MEKMQPILIHEDLDENIEAIKPKNGKTFTLKELYTYLNCELIEVIHGTSAICIIDEEGKLKGKDPNIAATFIMLGQYPRDILVGKAIICDPSYLE